ncbi:unnamed protein product, partial [marine sediment metagenome]
VKLSYLIHGEGQPIIFIHGYGAKKEIWKPQIKDICRKYKTITFDLRGTGESDRPDIPYTMKMLAEDIHGLMKAIEINKAHIVGRSFGGMIAQHFALMYPNKVDKLILIATNYGRKDNDWVEIAQNGRLDEIETIKSDPIKAFNQKSKWVFHIKFRREMNRDPNKKFYESFSMNDLIKESTVNPSRPKDIRNQHIVRAKESKPKTQIKISPKITDNKTPKKVAPNWGDYFIYDFKVKQKVQPILESAFYKFAETPIKGRIQA